MFWQHRFKFASAALLLVIASLAMLDVAVRSANERIVAELFLAAALVLGALLCSQMDWADLHPRWRLAPATASLGALLAATYLADAANTSHALIGFAAATAVILTYVGFTSSPGIPLLFSPLVIATLYLAHVIEPFRIPLALPLVAPPVAAMLGELVAALTDRNQRTQDQALSRSRRLARLEDVLRRFRRPTSLQEAAEEVATSALEIFDVDRAQVMLRDTTGGLIPVAVGQLSGTTEDNTPNPDDVDLVFDTLSGDEPRLVPIDGDMMLVLPLPGTDGPAGAVVVRPIDSDDSNFTIDLARLFGTQVGIAIEHLFEIDKLERATTRDELTGIGNRRHADALLASMDEGDALILLDLDGFKAVNDTLGHAAGDQVLQDLSRHLRDCLRDSDTSARLGGDEFLVVARKAFADPMAVADRILEGWSTESRSTTLSAGVALHQGAHSFDDTFDRADQALYRAKAAGKNQAHMWTQSQIATSSNGSSPPDSLAS